MGQVEQQSGLTIGQEKEYMSPLELKGDNLSAITSFTIHSPGFKSPRQ